MRFQQTPRQQTPPAPRLIGALATLAALAAFMAVASPATAQTRRPTPPVRRAPAPPRVFISADGTFLGGRSFGDSQSFPLHAELGRIESRYTVKAGPALNLSATVPLRRRLGVGVGITQFSRTSTTAVTGSVPHPFFFDRPRALDGSATGVRHQELAVHLQARGMVPLGRRTQAMVFGGPSFFRIRQDVVADVSWDAVYPYDTAPFSGATVTKATVTKVGVNVGGDVAYYLTRQVGVGVSAHYSGTTVEVPSMNGGAFTIRAGGVQAGGGLRLRF